MVHIPTATNAARMIGSVVGLSWVGLSRHPCAKIRVTKQVFDDHLSMYWPHEFDYWTFNKDAIARLGDTVLIKPMQSPLIVTVKFEIDRIIYRHGNVVNPLTGKQVVDNEWMEMREKRNALTKDLLTKQTKLVQSVT